ncbi:MAG: GNAT family N-acetyltransferase [Pseudomonadota bacterium]|nr:GNAT family N-acetyltransferase [Pseudomonadota bacterium]
MVKTQIESLIRPAQRDDAEIIADLKISQKGLSSELHSGFSRDTFVRDCFSEFPAFNTFVAEADNSFAGYAIFYWGYDVYSSSRGVYLADLYVIKNYRRGGIGKQLVKEVTHFTKRNGGRWIFWSVLKKNKVARQFYKTLAPQLNNIVMHGASGNSFDRLSDG